MLPTKFQFIWSSGFSSFGQVVSQEKIFLEIDQSETKILTTSHTGRLLVLGFYKSDTDFTGLRSLANFEDSVVCMKKYDATVALIGRKL
jgi:hypothetical protein